MSKVILRRRRKKLRRNSENESKQKFVGLYWSDGQSPADAIQQFLLFKIGPKPLGGCGEAVLLLNSAAFWYTVSSFLSFLFLMGENNLI